MVITSFISSILVLILGVWAYARLESTMHDISERQLLIEPGKYSYKMWKDMPVSMYQSFTFFNLTNWNQVKATGQKPRFVEVGPYVYRTVWKKSDVNFSDQDRLVSFSERKQWFFQPHLSKGTEDDQIWTINTPLMTALALIQNAPVITRNMVSLILDGLGEGAFIKRPIRSLLFEGYSDLIVSVGPLFDRRFANFNGKFAYLYNKNDSIDGRWTVSTGTEDLTTLNKIAKFQNAIVNMTTFGSGIQPQGLNEVKPECAPAWGLEQATNGQLFPRETGKFIFYPDLCRPIHLLPTKQAAPNGIKATRYLIDPRVFMNSSQVPSNKCYEMNPKAPLANALAATINSVTGANVAMQNLVASASSPFAMFSPPSNNHHNEPSGGLFERSNLPGSAGSFLAHNPLQGLAGALAGAGQDHQMSPLGSAPTSKLGRVRQLFNNIGHHFSAGSSPTARQAAAPIPESIVQQGSNAVPLAQVAATPGQAPVGASDRWITQFRFKWPKGVFSIGQCQLGAPIYASLPHFLDADEYYLDQVDGLKPNRSLHEFYIDLESSLRSIPVGAKARLQLNVATPELRFRNIPNAMIPVLWQEVTFRIDKPVQTLLFWSFTMMSTLCTLASLVLIIVGLVLMANSFIGGYKQRNRELRGKLTAESSSVHSASSTSSSIGNRRREGQRSSWQPHLIARPLQHPQQGSTSPRQRLGRSDNSGTISIDEEVHHGAAYNQAFNSCRDFPDRLSDNVPQSSLRCGPSSGNSLAVGSGSPHNQPSSRASSHCELVSSLGTTQHCTGCLLACLRHPQTSANNVPAIHSLLTTNDRQNHQPHPAGASDTGIVIQQQQQQQQAVATSDIDKAAILSSVDTLANGGCLPDSSSCNSSVYTQRSRSSFKQ